MAAVVLEWLRCLPAQQGHAGGKDAQAPCSIHSAQLVLSEEMSTDELPGGEPGGLHAAVGSSPPLPPAVRWLRSSGTDKHHLELVKIVLVSYGFFFSPPRKQTVFTLPSSTKQG